MAGQSLVDHWLSYVVRSNGYLTQQNRVMDKLAHLCQLHLCATFKNTRGLQQK